MIESNGWGDYCTWEHSQTIKDLYRQRSRREVEEMTAHAQAAELLATCLQPNDTLLDIGCGSGYFYHSLRKRGLNVEYWGVDASQSLIEIGKKELPAFGLDAERLSATRIEDLSGKFDHVICINVLSNIDNYHKPLERILKIAKKSVILRESLKHGAAYSYVRDDFLDNGIELKVYVNHYDQADIQKFIASYGFTSTLIEDRRSGGKPEMVIGYPHYWKFILAERVS